MDVDPPSPKIDTVIVYDATKHILHRNDILSNKEILPKEATSESDLWETRISSFQLTKAQRSSRHDWATNTLPAVWFVWTIQASDTVTNWFRLRFTGILEPGEDSIVQVDKMPCLEINWELIYNDEGQELKDRNNKIIREGSHFTTLVLEWLNVFDRMQRSLTVSSIRNFHERLARRIELEASQSSMDTTDEVQSSTTPTSPTPLSGDQAAEKVAANIQGQAFIDPYKTQLPLLKPQLISKLSFEASDKTSQAYLSYLLSGLYSMPCIVSPALLLILGGQQEILQPSSARYLTFLSTLLPSLDQFLDVYGPETKQIIGEDYQKNYVCLQTWFLSALQIIIRRFSALLFDPQSWIVGLPKGQGCFLRSLSSIREYIQHPSNYTEVKAFIVEWSILQTEYQRRLANLREVYIYGGFLGAGLWGHLKNTAGTISSQSKSPKDDRNAFKPPVAHYVDPTWVKGLHMARNLGLTGLHYPNFQFSIYTQMQYSVFNASSEKMVEAEAEYLRTTSLDSKWPYLLTPNLRAMLKTKKLDLTRSTNSHLHHKMCDPGMINLILAGGIYLRDQYPTPETSNKPEVRQDFRYQLVEENADAQVKDTCYLLEHTLAAIDERLTNPPPPRKEGDSDTQNINIFSWDVAREVALLGQMKSQYSEPTSVQKVKEMLKTTQKELSLWPPSSSIEVNDLNSPLLWSCFQLASKHEDKAVQEYLKLITSQVYNSIDSMILPMAAILHFQLLYLNLFVLQRLTL